MPLTRMRKGALPFLTLVALTLGLATAVPAADEARALEMLNALGCKGCHLLADNGGSFGPPLDGVGSRLGREQIRRQLVDPKGINPSSLMPSFAHLAAEDLDTLSGYLADLK